MSKPVGILRFLGTNCDRDVWGAVEALELKPQWIWYTDSFRPEDFSSFVVPGGFSHGDYLRCGALAAKAPVMRSLAEAAKKGFPVLGICNGFQILCEARLLPGALVRNERQRFVDRWVTLRHGQKTKWTNLEAGAEITLPVAHGEGRYYVEDKELQELKANGQIWWTYASASENPNGSVEDIAGVSNRERNVCGLMPHPERAMFDWMGGADGRSIMGAMLRFV